MMIHYAKNEEGKYNVVLTGRVTKDAQYSETPQKKTPKVSFSVAYGDGKFMNCVALGRGPLTKLCSCLEKGDMVFLTGVWSSREYTKKDGEKANWQEVNVEYLSVQSEPNIQTQGASEQNVNNDGGSSTKKQDPIDAINRDYVDITEEDDGELPF